MSPGTATEMSPGTATEMSRGRSACPNGWRPRSGSRRVYVGVLALREADTLFLLL